MATQGYTDLKLTRIKKRMISTCIFYTLITLGIYAVYWQYLLVKNTHTVKDNDSGCIKEMLCILFVPFYSIYWWFSRGKAVKESFTENGYTAYCDENAFIILSIFRLDIISMAIMQTDFNSLPSGSNKSKQENPLVPLLELNDVRTSFFTPAGEVKALNGVSFSLMEGDVLGIVGESGSGKSVTAYSIMGLLAFPGKLVGGTIQFNGHQIEKMTEKEFRKMRGNEVSIIFQDPMTSLNPVYTIGNQIEEVIKLHTNKLAPEAHERARELLELVGINEPDKRLKQYPHELSGGMRQRVMIAIALACEPKLLIADEPTTALDVTIQAQIIELMQELRKKLGMSIIMITHDLGVVASMCERIAVMYAGHIVEYGTTDEIFYEPHHEYTKGLINSIPKLNVQKTERLVPIEGQPVDLMNPPAGCPFAPRCDKCMKICLSEMPPKTQLSETHYSHCWLLQKEEAQKGAVQNG